MLIQINLDGFRILSAASDVETNQPSLCMSDKVSVTTGSKLFANKYLILTP